MRIVFGIIMAIVGILFVLYSEAIYNFLGPVGIAEKYLGSSGGSRLFYKLIGLLLIFIGFMIMTNLHVGTLEWIGTSMFGAYEPPPAEELRKAAQPEF